MQNIRSHHVLCCVFVTGLSVKVRGPLDGSASSVPFRILTRKFSSFDVKVSAVMLVSMVQFSWSVFQFDRDDSL